MLGAKTEPRPLGLQPSSLRACQWSSVEDSTCTRNRSFEHGFEHHLIEHERDFSIGSTKNVTSMQAQRVGIDPSLTQRVGIHAALDFDEPPLTVGSRDAMSDAARWLAPPDACIWLSCVSRSRCRCLSVGSEINRSRSSKAD